MYKLLLPYLEEKQCWPVKPKLIHTSKYRQLDIYDVMLAHKPHSVDDTITMYDVPCCVIAIYETSHYLSIVFESLIGSKFVGQAVHINATGWVPNFYIIEIRPLLEYLKTEEYIDMFYTPSAERDLQYISQN